MDQARQWGLGIPSAPLRRRLPCRQGGHLDPQDQALQGGRGHQEILQGPGCLWGRRRREGLWARGVRQHPRGLPRPSRLARPWGPGGLLLREGRAHQLRQAPPSLPRLRDFLFHRVDLGARRRLELRRVLGGRGDQGGPSGPRPRCHPSHQEGPANPAAPPARGARGSLWDLRLLSARRGPAGHGAQAPRQRPRGLAVRWGLGDLLAQEDPARLCRPCFLSAPAPRSRPYLRLLQGGPRGRQDQGAPRGPGGRLDQPGLGGLSRQGPLSLQQALGGPGAQVSQECRWAQQPRQGLSPLGIPRALGGREGPRCPSVQVHPLGLAARDPQGSRGVLGGRPCQGGRQDLGHPLSLLFPQGPGGPAHQGAREARGGHAHPSDPFLLWDPEGRPHLGGLEGRSCLGNRSRLSVQDVLGARPCPEGPGGPLARGTLWVLGVRWVPARRGARLGRRLQRCPWGRASR